MKKTTTTRIYMIFADTDQGIAEKIYHGGCIATACLIFAQECQSHVNRVAFYTLDTIEDKNGNTVKNSMDLFAERTQ